MALPFAVKDLPYWDSSTKKPLIAWSQSGIIASAVDRYVTFYIENENKVDIYSSIKCSDSQITTITWSQGFNSDGFTPLYLLIGNIEGDVRVYDLLRNTVLNSVHLREGSVISSVGSPLNALEFYIGSSKNTIYCIDFSPLDTPSLVWSLPSPYTPNILRISPHDYTQLLCFASTGEFSILGDIDLRNGAKIISSLVFSDHDHGQFMNCNFYPHLDNSIYIVATSGVFLYTFKDNVFTLIYSADSRSDIIYDAFFPKSDDRLIAIIHRTHIRLSCIDQLNLDSFQSVHAISDGTKDTFESSVGFLNNKLCLLSRGSIQMIQIANRKFRVYCIARFPFGKPTGICTHKNMISIANEYGFVGISSIPKDSPSYYVGSCTYNKLIRVINGRIHSLHALTDNLILISGTQKENQKVLIFDASNLKLRSVLKESQEISTKDKPVVVVSPNKKYFAVSLGDSILALFTSLGKQITSFTNNQKTFVVFCSDPDELLAISSNGNVYDFELSDDNCKLKKSFLLQIERETITTVCSSFNCFYVGTKSGKLYNFGWDMKQISNCQVSNKPLSEIIIGESKAIVTDNNFGTFRVGITHDLVSKQMKSKVDVCQFLSEDYLICCLKEEKSISVLSSNDLESRFERIPTFFLETPVLFSDYARKEYFGNELKKCKNLEAAWKLCDRTGYFILGELLRLKNKIFSPLVFDISGQEKLHSLFESLSYMFIRSRGDNATDRRVRMSLLRNDRQKALEVFLTPNNSLNNFEKNVLKAGYLNLESSAESAAVVAALIGNGCYATAIDILLITKQYGQAARLCLQNSEMEMALHISCSLCRDEDKKETVDKVAKSLAGSRNVIHAAALHLLNDDVPKAVECLQHKLDISSIIKLF
ncbi:hypothetical protein TVAG_358860 [Trichomonas vaginalis G3]|uniref:Anaphase-promoting complex subunit 4 WD40 domain-containing protein n=1 Tax=Trichomonas vaginalis (strain ATCC PRA-98 / G3) TaxID=412133 RepID=A2E889_TRIV3|nr:quinoprotein alcohol dehydrogenase-like family [Trichomonas vaginalis G3]EAY11107.1 hypothetical protein TVAG_358860 [Trichomonas vaginalis G3]KAI5492594.1 quinoprotein alcohol dehydrogenase-like family [Trichomonas vaginalis G3]|eukprot:XP_001323330.1 hypothetical protein [Trichomonas vaginalis G3]